MRTTLVYDDGEEEEPLPDDREICDLACYVDVGLSTGTIWVSCEEKHPHKGPHHGAASGSGAEGYAEVFWTEQ